MRVTRRYQFSASHRLHSARLSEDENRAVYGKCNNPHGHGHNYTLEISAEGPVDEVTGLAVNVERLDRLVQETVLREFHMKNLNYVSPDFTDAVPTTENLLAAIERRLRQAWPSAFPGGRPKLERIRVEETKRNTFETWLTGQPQGSGSNSSRLRSPSEP
jgi:6-pyruvoyltetrahydropterin/6-carboxytetrahydropterin synthase